MTEYGCDMTQPGTKTPSRTSKHELWHQHTHQGWLIERHPSVIPRDAPAVWGLIMRAHPPRQLEPAAAGLPVRGLAVTAVHRLLGVRGRLGSEGRAGCGGGCTAGTPQ